MRENCTSGTVPGAPGNRSPYGGGQQQIDLRLQGEHLGLDVKVLA